VIFRRKSLSSKRIVVDSTRKEEELLLRGGREIRGGISQSQYIRGEGSYSLSTETTTNRQKKKERNGSLTII